MLAHSEMLVRIAVGAALGGAIGYERSRHRRPVGMRTHLLVALASATFMVVSSQFAYYQRFGDSELIEVDASRIAASVVSAIGFLAGGAILRSGVNVRGLTTAAALWLVTAIGLCAGAGMFVESIAVTSVGIVALTLLRRFERRDDRIKKRRIAVVLEGDAESATTMVMTAVTDLGAVVLDCEYDRRLDDVRRTDLTLDVGLPADVTVSKLIATLETLPDVKRIRISLPS